MKKKSLIILILTVSALTLSACNGCGAKKEVAQATSEVPLIVLEDKNATKIADKPEVETSEDDTSKDKEAKKDENKKVPVVIEDKNTQKTTTTTKPQTQTTPQTQTQQTQQAQPQQNTTTDSGWQTPSGQTSTPQTQPQTPTVADTPTPAQSDDGTITLPLIPLN